MLNLIITSFINHDSLNGHRKGVLDYWSVLFILSNKLVLLWAQLTMIYHPLPTSVQPISITKTLLIVPTKNERDPPLFTGKLLIKFQNIGSVLHCWL
jgi:hypothetical protein